MVSALVPKVLKDPARFDPGDLRVMWWATQELGVRSKGQGYMWSWRILVARREKEVEKEVGLAGGRQYAILSYSRQFKPSCS